MLGSFSPSGVLKSLALVLCMAPTAWAGTNVYVGSASTAKSVSLDQIDHSDWAALLSRYVNEDGGVRYQAWHDSSADRSRLRGYLKQLSTADPDRRASKNARLAFWINAYNAVTIEGILREYPTSSIRNHTAKLFGYNIWDDLQLYVGGDAHSLNQIEHKILRPMGDPRIHFAIVCASQGCPRLLNDAYVADRIDDQLTTNAKHFFAQSQNFVIRGRKIHASAILDWFGEDFGSSSRAVLKRIDPWLSESQRKLVASSGHSLTFLDYDWSLNEAK